MSTAWDNEWKSRTNEHGISRNLPKAKYICKKLWDRPYLIPMKKLEIGCGESPHIAVLSKYCREWKENYVGVDASPYIVDIAVRKGLNVFCGDILDIDFNGKKFNLFLFLDVLEHIMDLERLAEKIKSLAEDDLVIIGNVPMAPNVQRDPEIEDRPVTLKELADFSGACGCETIDHEIYGSFGYPYLFFEATNYGGGA